MRADKPFTTIESSLEFIVLLEESIDETLTDVLADLEEARNAGDQRAAEALLLVSHKVTQLSTHIQKSRRLLNDLRMLRRVILQERGTEPKRSSAAAVTAVLAR